MDKPEGHKYAAFPYVLTNEEGEKIHFGMSLRDYFAAKAIAGMMASNYSSASPGRWDIPTKHAYEIADAMLEARRG